MKGVCGEGMMLVRGLGVTYKLYLRIWGNCFILCLVILCVKHRVKPSLSALS